MTAAEATYQSAQPSLKIGDQRQERLEAGLLRLEVREQISGLCRLEATFGNWGEQGDGWTICTLGTRWNSVSA